MDGAPPSLLSTSRQALALATGSVVPALVAAEGDQAATRFREFVASTIRNSHTRRAYGRAVGDFLAWCEAHAVMSVAAVQPLHVAAWLDP